MCDRQAFAIFIGCQRTEYRGHRSTDIRTYRKGKRIDVVDLTGSECGYNNRHGRTAGLNNNRGNRSEKNIHKHAQVTLHCILGQVQALL